MSEPPSPQDADRPRRRPWLWPLLIVALLFAGVVVLWVPPERTTPLLTLGGVVVTGLGAYWSRNRR